jgi:hypothetical protein
MKCPKCGYTSFPHLGSCGKCGRPLADARELYGVYALSPNPPDLTLTYEPAQIEWADVMPREAISQPTIDFTQLHDLDLALASPDEASFEAVGDQTPLEVLDNGELVLDRDHTSAALPPPQDLDQPPSTADMVQVFELALDDDEESLTLTPVEEGSSVHGKDADTPEYILEIDEELELEVEDIELDEDPHDDATDEENGHGHR